MKEYDVVIIGAGPAGGQCARELSARGKKVLLVERFADFSKNDFSSAGTPLETIKVFALPDSVVASRWKNLEILSSHRGKVWKSDKELGVVMDFAKLRSFLASETKKHGGDILMGHSFFSYEYEADHVMVTLINNTNHKQIHVNTKLLVDATGPARAVMNLYSETKHKYSLAIGLEYLIEVDKARYFGDTLVFFMGQQWMPKGYGWVFPMKPNLFKVGVGYGKFQSNYAPPKPLTEYLNHVISDYLKIKTYKVVDKHGGTLQYSKGNKDEFYKGSIIAIGDSVSSVNYLGFEGIRHALYCARIAADHIVKYLDGDQQSLIQYEPAMRRYFGKTWRLCEILSERVYGSLNDWWMDRGISYLDGLSAEDLVDILFNYKFTRMFAGLDDLAGRKLKKIFRRSKLQTTTS